MGRDTDASGGSANGGNGEGNSNEGRGGGGRGDGGRSSTPRGLKSIEEAHKGLGLAGPQLSRARDNAITTGLSYGIQALGMMGLPFAGPIAMGVRAVRDYGRGYAERTSMEKAADANGMGASTHGDSSGPPVVSGGLAGIAKPAAQAPAPAAASGNIGSGSAGATVIMGAEKTRTGAGAGSRAKSGSAVRGFGSGGLKL